MSPTRVLSIALLASPFLCPCAAAREAQAAPPPASSAPAPQHQPAAAQPAADAPFRLLEHRELGLALRKIAAEHPEVAAVLPVGTSQAGRAIEALRLALGERAPGRPAVLVLANVDGPYVYTSGLALELAERISRGYADDPKLRALLESTTLYVVPRGDPDAAEARFAKPLEERQASGRGVDQDRDGRNGEDGPSDVDGDGLVTMLRVRDPEGEWITDPTEPRAMQRAEAKKGEHGIWKLWPEGRDSDHDERVGEDPELDVVVDRNFPQGWQEHAAAAGEYATDRPEARALCDFVLAHDEIALVVVYGALDNLVEKPKSVREDAPFQKRLPPDGLLEPDAELLAEIGRRYAKIGKNESKSAGDEHGSFAAWCQQQRGAWCLAIRPWSIPLDEAATPKGEGKPAEKDASPKPGGETAGGSEGAGKESAAKDSAATQVAAKETAAKEAPAKESAGPQGSGAPSKEGSKKKDDEPGPSEDAKRLRWIDAHGEGARFVPWKSFAHPELGDVEIGGFAPYATLEPPASEHERIAAREFALLSSLGELLPRVSIRSCTAKSLGGDLWQIEAAVENGSLLPLLSATARRARSAIRPARVRLRLPPGGHLVAGPVQELVADLRGSGGRRELRWIVQGAPAEAFEIEVDTSHAGTARATPEVKR